MDPQTPDQVSPSQPVSDQPVIVSPTPAPVEQKNSKTLIYLLGIAVFLILIAVGAYLWNGGFDQKQEAAQVVPTQAPTSTPIPDPTANWKTYTIASVGLEFKLPPELTSLGELKEEIVQGEQGSLVCVSFFPENYDSLKSNNTVNNSGICDHHIVSAPFFAGTSSVDFQQGRGGTFSDLQGFKKENNKYYAKFVDGKTFEISNELAEEFYNKNNVSILKVVGKSYEGGEMHGLPIGGTPGNGRIGAIINTRNSKYPGFIMDVELNKITYETFNKILSTFKFTEQNQSHDTSSWQILVNSPKPFIFKHPSNWAIVEDENKVEVYPPEANIMSGENLNSLIFVLPSKGLEFNAQTVKETMVVVDGQTVKRKEGIEFISNKGTLIHVGPLTKNGQSYMVVFTSGNKAANKEYISIFDALISTFQFK